MCMNGAPTGMALIITAKALMKIRRVLRVDNIAYYGAVRGTVPADSCDVRAATSATRIIVLTMSGFVVFVSL